MAKDIDEAKSAVDAALKSFEDNLKKLRTGRANASMLDDIRIDVYGQATPLNHAATIAVVDATLLQISPFDPNNLEAISAAIRDDTSLGLNPADDGRVVRVPIPPMTTERREEVVKSLHEKAEQARISIRNTRHDLFKSLKNQVNDSELSEDEKNNLEKEFEQLQDDAQSKIEDTVKAKEQEIMTV